MKATMHLHVGIDDIATETATCEGWTFFILPEVLRSNFDREAKKIICRTTLQAFHAKNYKRRYKCAYREFLQLIRDVSSSTLQSRAVNVLFGRNTHDEICGFAERLIVKSCHKTLLSRIPGYGEVIDAIKQYAMPTFTLIREAKGLGPGLTMEIELDAGKIARLDGLSCDLGGTTITADDILKSVLNAYRKAKCPKAPAMAKCPVRLVNDQDSFMVQAADILGNFSMAYVFKQLGKCSQTIIAKTDLLLDVYGDLMEEFTIGDQLTRDGNDLVLKTDGALTFKIIWAVTEKGEPRHGHYHTEKAFETAIEHHLITAGGYIKGDSEAFDRERCIDPGVLLAFIKETQPKEWEYLEDLQKDKAEEILLDDLCGALNSEHEGCVAVLRHGFKCFGKLFRVAYFAPASGLNPETQKLYAANRLIVTRQVHYSNKHNNSLDVVLSLNGIPVATVELKNPMTGQTWRNAMHQYKNDRDSNDLMFKFKKRTLVHFAVDTDEVYMTTRLSGRATHFLPFNLGHGTGAGNPENPGGYKSAYLWEQVLGRDSFLDILARFIHLEIKEKKFGGKRVKKETMIFPRYHQLDCVRKLVADAREKGTGTNYLVQHSAGSGKSNSIAWLAHRLASLYNEKDERVFDSVVVVTDRLVLDQQLQNTIYQFEHKQGVVQKIDINSTQLAEAIATGVPIVITTLQKFPFVTEKIGELSARKYAVIIDEAHSSQGGESATELKGVLARAAIKEEIEARTQEQMLPDHEEEILRTMAKRGRQPNIGFFAFTATPKYKTLEVFGQDGPDGKPQPFHLYSMRQAIEENFILDVLQSYTTYKTYFRLIKSIEDDPEVDKRKAARALARFMSLHPHNIAQKTEVMIEHFRHFTMHKIGGKAKAMVVTSSRLHAVRYKQSFDKYIAEKGYKGIKTLVAFSGQVIDPDAPTVEYTEVGMNKGIREKELPERFATDEYQVLLVAEKYQTGFDQPLLHTMYVDKRLAGIQAVQTLSRLNRTHPGKEDTFVLDFVNEPEEILAGFQPYYEQTLVGERADARQLYELQAKLDSQQVYHKAEIEEFAKVFYSPGKQQTPGDHARMNACIDPAVNRYKKLDPEVREEFRKVLVAYRNLYAFLSQVIPFQDSDLEKLYSYIRFLLTKLPRGDRGPVYNFDDEVALKFYRLQKIGEQSITLESGKAGEISGPVSVGTSTSHGEHIGLSELIDILNERFGTEFKPADQLFLDSIREDAVADTMLRQAALANTMENFGYVFLKSLEGLFIDRMDQNEEITAKFMNEKQFQEVVGHHLLKQVYEQIRSAKTQGDEGTVEAV